MDAKAIHRAKPSLAHWTGLGGLIAAGLLLMVDWRLSVITIGLYMLVGLAALFRPNCGFFLPVISHGCTGQNTVALTFDDGPDPLATPALLKMLKTHGIKATFFVTGIKAARYPDLVQTIVTQGHTVGNHSYSHDALIGLKGCAAIRKEIMATQNFLQTLNIIPLVFRPPLGIIGPGLRKPLMESDLTAVNFSCRALDCGNRRIEGIAARILNQVRSDDIIMLHDIMPKGSAYTDDWLKEVALLLAGLKSKELTVIALADVIGQPVMKLIDNGEEKLM